MHMNFLGVLLYSLLGGVLGANGIGVVDNTMVFIMVMVIVLAIEVNSGYCTRQALEGNR